MLISRTVTEVATIVFLYFEQLTSPFQKVVIFHLYWNQRLVAWYQYIESIHPQ